MWSSQLRPSRDAERSAPAANRRAPVIAETPPAKTRVSELLDPSGFDTMKQEIPAHGLTPEARPRAGMHPPRAQSATTSIS
jgi:hypothetical protein